MLNQTKYKVSGRQAIQGIVQYSVKEISIIYCTANILKVPIPAALYAKQ